MSQQRTTHQYLTVDQIEQLRDASYSTTHGMRNETLVVLLSDLGVRVSELVSLRRGMFDLQNEEVMLPRGIQKSPPTEREPSAATLRLDALDHFSTPRLLRRYFSSDWWQDQETSYVFPSRQSDQMSERSVRNTVTTLANESGVNPRSTRGERDDPDELHPHAFRHSLANYMLADESVRLIDVRNRLRHNSIRTTEQIYEHFQRR